MNKKSRHSCRNELNSVQLQLQLRRTCLVYNLVIGLQCRIDYFAFPDIKIHFGNWRRNNPTTNQHRNKRYLYQHLIGNAHTYRDSNIRDSSDQNSTPFIQQLYCSYVYLRPCIHVMVVMYVRCITFSTNSQVWLQLQWGCDGVKRVYKYTYMYVCIMQLRRYA